VIDIGDPPHQIARGERHDRLEALPGGMRFVELLDRIRTELLENASQDPGDDVPVAIMNGFVRRHKRLQRSRGIRPMRTADVAFKIVE